MVKFDVVVGNPPYQEDREGTRAKQIYPHFMDSAYEIADKVILITPGRFLFNAGATSKEWNEKMLNDAHLKIVDYEPIGQAVFPNTDIKGGVAITYRDTAESFEPIDFFVPNKTMKEILVKVEAHKPMETLDSIFYSQSSYKITRALIDDFKDHKEVYKRNAGSTVKTNLFDKLNYIFLEDEPFENEEYFRMFGRTKNRRVYRWVKREYIDTPKNFKDWKVMLPKANGSGHFGEVLSSPEIGRPFAGHTETFVSFGSFRNEAEALACLIYIKSKFARSLLGTLKITQDNTKRVWAKVPLQDFTKDSDIDWTKSIAEIDQQLYAKYGLSEEEITFIETHVKQMD